MVNPSPCVHPLPTRTSQVPPMEMGQPTLWSKLARASCPGHVAAVYLQEDGEAVSGGAGEGGYKGATWGCMTCRTHEQNSVPICQSKSFGQKKRNVPLSALWKTSKGLYTRYSPLQMRSYSPNILESPTSAETVYVSHGHMRGNRGGGAEGAAAIARGERRRWVLLCAMRSAKRLAAGLGDEDGDERVRRPFNLLISI